MLDIRSVSPCTLIPYNAYRASKVVSTYEVAIGRWCVAVNECLTQASAHNRSVAMKEASESPVECRVQPFCKKIRIL